MSEPQDHIVLTKQQVTEILEELRSVRHKIANDVTVIIGSADIISLRPDKQEQMLQTIRVRPFEISNSLKTFSAYLISKLDPEQQNLQANRPSDLFAQSSPKPGDMFAARPQPAAPAGDQPPPQAQSPKPGV